MRNKGYTIIELIVVIFIIGIMLALSMPRFRYAVLTDNLTSTVRRFNGLVKGVRSEAIRKQKAYVLCLDLESNRLWVDSNSMNQEERQAAQERAFVLPDGVTVMDVWRREAGKQAHGEATIYFSKKGYIEHTVIHLGADDGRRFTLVLSPFLGTVKSYDKYVDIYE